MEPKIIKAESLIEFETSERCFIMENWNSTKKANISIARARVKPGVTTKLHYLKGVSEIYLITKGKGRVMVGNLKPTKVGKGDLVFIPAGVHQQISNTGNSDLIFYCICTPRFSPECNIFI